MSNTRVLWLVMGENRVVRRVVADVGRKYLKARGMRFRVEDLVRVLSANEVIQEHVRAFAYPCEANEVADAEIAWEALKSRLALGRGALKASQLEAALQALDVSPTRSKEV
jgi:hypothetical protein